MVDPEHIGTLEPKIKMVIITKAEYDRLLADSSLLERLREKGVDNWEGYGDDDVDWDEED